MAILIDGYNLLHVTGIVGRGPAGLEQSREALLRFLAASIDPAELPHSAIVFDAAEAPPGLPAVLDRDGLTVYFARDFPDADTMLEELIRQHDAPRRLTVVSSDHRVQRAARRRRAQAVDSDRWYAELLVERRKRERTGEALPAKPDGPLDPAEVAYWLEEFAAPEEPGSKSRPGDSAAAAEEVENPFPPGYGEDLLEEEE